MDNEKFESIIQQSIAEEYEAAANYTKRAAKCEEKGMEDAAKLFRDIAQEEMVHVGEFQALMEKYDMTNLDAIKQGEEEAKELLNAKVSEEFLNENWFDNVVRFDGKQNAIEFYMKKSKIASCYIIRKADSHTLMHIIDPEHTKPVSLDDFHDSETYREYIGGIANRFGIDVDFSKLEDEKKEILGAEVPVENLEESINEGYVHKVTKTEWDRTHDDYKMIKNGRKYMMYIDPEKHMTVLGPVEIVDEEPANEDVPNKNVYVDAHIQGRAKILSDGGYSHEANGKYCYDVELEDGRKMQVFKSEIKPKTEKSANEEFLDKGEIYARLIQLLDLTTNEDTKAVSLLGDITNFLDVDQLQSFYEYVQEETGMNYDEIFGSKEDLDEAAEPQREAVMKKFEAYIRAILKERGIEDLSKYSAENVEKFVYSENVFFHQLAIAADYGDNLEQNPNFQGCRKVAVGNPELTMTLEEDRYFWDLNDARHWTLAKQIAKRLMNSNESVNEDINASSSVYVRAVDEELDSEVIELAKKCKSIYEFEKADPELSQECELFTTINGNEFSGSDLEDLCDNINYSYENAYIEPNLDEWVIEEEQNCIRVGYILVEANDNYNESSDNSAQYGVQYRSMHTGIHNLIITDNKEHAERILNLLEELEDATEETDVYGIWNEINEFSTDCVEINYRDTEDGTYGDIIVINGAEPKPDIYESADPDTAIFYSVEACYVDRDPQNYNSYDRLAQFASLEEARKFVREELHALDTIKYSGLCIASSEYEYNDEDPDELTDTYEILEFYPVAGEVQKFNENEEISDLAFLNSGDIIKTKDGKEAVIEGLLYDSNNIHIGYEITYLDQEDSSYEYSDVLFDNIAEVLSRASNENGTMASMGAAPAVVAGKGIVTAEPTKICEELKALKEALKG